MSMRTYYRPIFLAKWRKWIGWRRFLKRDWWKLYLFYRGKSCERHTPDMPNPPHPPPKQTGSALVFSGQMKDKPLALPPDCKRWRIRERPGCAVELFMLRDDGRFQKWYVKEGPALDARTDTWVDAVVPAFMNSQNAKGKRP